MKPKLHDLNVLDENSLENVVIAALYKGKWVYVKYSGDQAWGLPGGSVKLGETPHETAKRRLSEETGAEKFHIEAVCDYSMPSSNKSSYKRKYGRLFFSRIKEIGEPSDLSVELVSVFDSVPDQMKNRELEMVLYQKVNSIRLLVDRIK